VFGISSFAQMNGHANTNGYTNDHVPTLSNPINEDITPHDTDYIMEDDDDEEKERDPDAMDWSPIHPAHRNDQRANNHRPSSLRQEDILLRPQRFFAPEEPTGLENLFANTIKLADDNVQRLTEEKQRNGWMHWVKGRWKS
jgi:hypothetical protein